MISDDVDELTSIGKETMCNFYCDFSVYGLTILFDNWVEALSTLEVVHHLSQGMILLNFLATLYPSPIEQQCSSFQARQNTDPANYFNFHGLQYDIELEEIDPWHNQ